MFPAGATLHLLQTTHSHKVSLHDGKANSISST